MNGLFGIVVSILDRQVKGYSWVRFQNNSTTYNSSSLTVRFPYGLSLLSYWLIHTTLRQFDKETISGRERIEWGGRGQCLLNGVAAAVTEDSDRLLYAATRRSRSQSVLEGPGSANSWLWHYLQQWDTSGYVLTPQYPLLLNILISPSSNYYLWFLHTFEY